MKYYLWLVLRLLGMALVILLCMTIADDVGFIAGVAQRADVWPFILVAAILFGILAWAFRVVWVRLNPMVKRRWWRYAQGIAGVLIILLVVYAGLQGLGDGDTFHNEIRAQNAAARLLTPTDPTEAGAFAVLKEMPGQAKAAAVGSHLIDVLIQLSIIVVFLIVVTITRVLVWRGKKPGPTSSPGISAP